jgi:hypothetical protein
MWQRQIWKDNIENDIGETGCGYINWIEPAEKGEKWWSFVAGSVNEIQTW